MRVLVWHIHGSWTTSFVQGQHNYLLPVVPDRGPDGRGRARTWTWPESAVEVMPAALADAEVDVMVLQRPSDVRLAEEWTGRRPGRDVPAVYVEHNTPGGPAATTRHFLADQSDIPIAHVTHFNRLFWDCGKARTCVVEHGIVDPGHRYSGEWPRAAVVINDPVRRGRAVGTDLLPALATASPLDVFGMNVHALPGSTDIPADRLWTFEDLPQSQMHFEVARRRVYVHTSRWTSLGLSLLEAMHLGMPVVALATTEVVRAVPPRAGVVSTRLDDLVSAVWRFIHDPMEAQAAGSAAREAALSRYGLGRFLADWDALLLDVVAGRVSAKANAAVTSGPTWH
ncbi:MAG: glycosyltransferase [Propionibacteriales bacterium]|nr:glycosyltransferase [Propionibacteriales bacterium]